MISKPENTLVIFNSDDPSKLNIHSYYTNDYNKDVVETFIKKLGYKNIKQIDWIIFDGKLEINDTRNV